MSEKTIRLIRANTSWFTGYNLCIVFQCKLNKLGIMLCGNKLFKFLKLIQFLKLVQFLKLDKFLKLVKLAKLVNLVKLC